ncbi:MAG: hypothetical protein ACI9MJ_002267 [Alphaproteobacteria bacterium]|jgi:hypothetical protein
MQRKIRFIALALCVALPFAAFSPAAVSPVAAAERFLSVIDDLPLMPALTEIAGSAVTFSKPGGRIVEVAATGKTEMARVLVFYARTLPQLGWRSDGAAIWQRDGERLSLAIQANGDALVVQFSLAPQ